MEYKAIGSKKTDIIDKIFENRGVKRKDLFLNPSEESIQDPRVYENMDKAYELFYKYFLLRDTCTIGLVVDPDVDGYTGNAALYIYLKEIGFKNIKVFVHKHRKHGLTPFIMEEISKVHIDFLIIVDAGSNDYEQHKVLKERDIDILVLDHHETDRYSENAIVVNNQLSKEGNKNLSGAGVCMKFLELLDDELNLDITSNLYDLVASSLISDCMLLNDLENRIYLKKGLNKINNNVFKFFLNYKDKVTINEMTINLGSYINAVTRLGDVDIKLDLFYALVGELNETQMLKTLVDVKELRMMQTQMVSDLSKELKPHGDIENSPFLYFILTDENAKGFSGLIASMFSRKYRKPCLVFYKEGEIYRGSARNDNDRIDFKKYLLETKKFIYCQGHKNAFGVCISKSNLEHLDIECRDKPLQNEIYYVDEAYCEGQVSSFDICKVNSLKDYWCRGFEEPIFYIKISNIYFNDIIIVGENSDTVKIVNDYVNYLFFKMKPKQILEMKSYDCFDLEIIGRFNINEWNGRSIPQVIVEDYEIVNSRSAFSFEQIQNPFFVFKV